jgi:hypothetical protein
MFMHMAPKFHQIRSLSNSTVNSSYYIVSDGGMVDELEGMSKDLFWYLSKGTEENFL